MNRVDDLSNLEIAIGLFEIKSLCAMWIPGGTAWRLMGKTESKAFELKLESNPHLEDEWRQTIGRLGRPSNGTHVVIEPEHFFVSL